VALELPRSGGGYQCWAWCHAERMKCEMARSQVESSGNDDCDCDCEWHHAEIVQLQNSLDPS